MGNYALGMAGSCNCSSSSGDSYASAAPMIVNGLYSVSALDRDLIIDQGTTHELLLCFTNGNIGAEVKCIKKNGTLVFAKEDRPCYKSGDLVRLVGFDNCVSDASQVYEVDGAPTLVDNLWNLKLKATTTPAGPNPVTAFAHLEFENDLYCFSGGTVKTVPIGCVQDKARDAEAAPRLLPHIPAPDLALSGAVFAKHDYFDEFGLSFDGGNEATVANAVIGRIAAGDFLMSKDAGLSEPVRVTEVRRVEVMKADGSGTEFIERLILDRAVVSTACALVQVRRGASLDLEIEPDGSCWRIIIPGGDTAGMQFNDSDRTDKGYWLGTYTITATWATLRGGKLAPRSEVIRAGNAYVRPTHMFTTPLMK
jgi:hypothetical protein